jgi:hypothetical protein
MNSMYSLRKIFHKTEGGINWANEFLSGINLGRLGWEAGVTDSIHTNSIRPFLFSFSYCDLFLFHPIIFVYFIFAYLHSMFRGLSRSRAPQNGRRCRPDDCRRR